MIVDKMRFFWCKIFFLASLICFSQEKREYKIVTVSFYNLENLFWLEDDSHTIYHNNTIRAEGFYTPEVYNAKLKNLAKVISEIGYAETGTTPSIVGLCEVENRQVIEDLINQEPLADSDYGIIHYNSPDRRGIDVALIYKKSVFIPIHHQKRELLIYRNNDILQRIYTRDQLVVTGLLDGEEIHLIVNHWPSRSGGEVRSRPNRIKAAQLTKKIVDSLHHINPYSKILIMGDFNDDPTSESIKKFLGSQAKKENLGIMELYNPMEDMYRKGFGTLAWMDRWNLFDQIIVSAGLLSRDYTGFQFYKTRIFNPNYLANPKGRFKGYPYRAYGDGGFTGGYSDHFPVYTLLIKEKN